MSKKGILYINDKDAWVTWSALLIDSSYNELETHAPMKEYTSNNARSQHGEQIFVSDPRVDKRSVILTFDIACASTEDYLSKKRALEAELTKGTSLFKVTPLKRVYKLLIDNNSTFNLTMGTGLKSGKLAIRFTEPNPNDRIEL